MCFTESNVDLYAASVSYTTIQPTVMIMCDALILSEDTTVKLVSTTTFIFLCRESQRTAKGSSEEMWRQPPAAGL